MLPSEIFIAGKMRSGKDFVGSVLAEQGYVRLAFADALKREVAALNHITVEELNANKAQYRREMQDYGAAKREVDENYWIVRWVEARQEIPGPVYVPDTRYNNEALFAIERGAMIIRVKTPVNIRIQRIRELDGVIDLEALRHKSETDIDNLPMHLEIDGTLRPTEILPMLELGYQQLMGLRKRVNLGAQPKFKQS